MEGMIQRAVSWMIKQQPWMAQYRDDLEQEARVAYLDAIENFDSGRANAGVTAENYAFFKIKHALQNWTRNEVKHWSKPLLEDSPYWDIDEGVDVERLPAEEKRDFRAELQDALQCAKLTHNQRLCLEAYLQTDSVVQAALELRWSHQQVSETLQRIVSKVKKSIAKSGPDAIL